MRENAIRYRHIDGNEAPDLMLVCMDSCRRDIEPPTMKTELALRDPAADHRVGHQMVQLLEHVRLRKLIV